MNCLKKFDKIAYIRFASVYRSFADVDEFAKELGDLLSAPKKRKTRK
jgi:transcriptional repressor NrdR